IVGILEEKPERDLTRTKPRLILIAHGALGHKNYLYQRLLAEKLPYSSFRFDFRGNGDSSGEARYSNFAEDTEDIYEVANYFENQGYEIWALVGHSRGSASCFKYATTCEKPLAHVVNVSGRYDMKDSTTLPNLPANKKLLQEQGYFLWSFKKQGKILETKVTVKEAERFANWDNSHVVRMPKTTSVLTCHGLADTLVPPYNGALFANKISTHTLRLIPDADHNFTGKTEELVDIILDYFEQHEK
ncbi:ectomycorrhiza-regulated esterase, partial [Halteromyces radiatus]|uniref:ectomycorrhiza-regulated esterase n=1 Tax=Halteromyces radiatus TaxID=101107 RepID=UPI00221F1E11